MSENVDGKPYLVKTQDKYKKNKWTTWLDCSSKIEAERECLRIVHEAIVYAAIVVEMKPVVVTRVSRDNGVRMTYQQTILDEDYQ